MLGFEVDITIPYQSNHNGDSGYLHTATVRVREYLIIPS